MIGSNINIFCGNVIVDFLIKHNIKYFCVSPGSRSTPLALAVAGNPEAEAKLFYDERAAAYYALSYSRGSGLPTALICTSGTAVANYFPGLIEADQSLLPIAVLTADRPDELQNCGANQTIDQGSIYGQFVSTSVMLEAPDNDLNPCDLLDCLDKAFADFRQPVHVNCRFREPLALPDGGFDASKYGPIVDGWYASRQLKPEEKQAGNILSGINDAVSLINRAKRGVIISGPANPVEKQDAIVKLARRLNWPVLCDALSPLKSVESNHLLNLYDFHVDESECSIPDMVIHLGGLPTSKRLNQFLSANRSVPYIKIQSHERTIDPDRLETIRLTGPTESTISGLINNCDESGKTDWLKIWQKRESLTRDCLTDYFTKNDASESALAFALPEILKDGEALFLSNSMPVRDADSFGVINNKDIIVGANRGVSGIDGIIASACGFANGCQRPTILIIGDLAFIHDMNSLLLAAQSNFPIRIVVINNDGGGIFHFLDVADIGENFEPFFGTPHGMRFESAALQFALPYRSCETVSKLKEDYVSLCLQGGSFVIEFESNRSANHNQQNSIRRMISQQLSKLGD